MPQRNKYNLIIALNSLLIGATLSESMFSLDVVYCKFNRRSGRSRTDCSISLLWWRTVYLITYMYCTWLTIGVQPWERDWQLIAEPGVINWLEPLVSQLSLFAAFEEWGAILTCLDIIPFVLTCFGLFPRRDYYYLLICTFGLCLNSTSCKAV